MISSIAWVRRGAPARVPTTEGGLHEAVAGEAPSEPAVAASASGGSEGGKAAGKRRSAADKAAHEDDDDDHEDAPVLTAGNLMYHRSNKDDPNITINEDEEVDSEIDDYEIGETDLVLLGARSDEHPP